jgi:hypothetical protein
MMQSAKAAIRVMRIGVDTHKKQFGPMDHRSSLQKRPVSANTAKNVTETAFFLG